jgi:hypothetical protein
MVPEDLSIPRLLQQLEADPRNDAIKLCVEAESLCRRQYFKRAVEAAQHAECIAHEVFDSELKAITQLYLGAMYAAHHSSEEDERAALRSCGRAIRALSLHPRNYAIAQLIRAQIELQFGQQDEAIIHFYQTAQYLQKPISAARERREMNKVELYQALRDGANAAIGEIYGKFIAVEARRIASKKRRSDGMSTATTIAQSTMPRPSLTEAYPFELPVQLDWPATVELLPMNMSIANQAALLPGQVADAIDYIELTEISINGRRYAVEPLYAIPTDSRGAFRMYRDREYVPVHIRAGAGQAELSNSYLLIQKQDRPEREAGVIVLENLSRAGARAFRYELDKTLLGPPRIIGAEDRSWTFQDHAEPGAKKREPHIIGTAVAWLKPLS